MCEKEVKEEKKEEEIEIDPQDIWMIENPVRGREVAQYNRDRDIQTILNCVREISHTQHVLLHLFMEFRRQHAMAQPPNPENQNGNNSEQRQP